MSRKLLQGGVGSLVVRIAGTALTLVVAILLARLLGPEEFGAYSLVIAVVAVVALPAQLGLPTLVVRETAKASAEGNWELVHGLWRWSDRAVLLFTTGIILVGLILFIVSKGTRLSAFMEEYWYAFALLPLGAFISLRGAAIRGFGAVVTGQLPDTLIRPAVLILGILLSLSFLKLDSHLAVALNISALVSALAISMWLLKKLPQTKSVLSSRAIPRSAEWRAAALPLGMLAGAQVLNQHTDILMLGAFSTSENVGVYRAVIAASSIISFGLVTISVVIGPDLAIYFSQGNAENIRQLIRWSIAFSAAVAVPCTLIILVFGEQLLAIVFGEPYRLGYLPFVIIATGQLATSIAGPVGILLNMTGHERETLRGISIATLLNIVLNALLIPDMGMVGAAIATSVSLATWNILLWHSAHRKLGFGLNIFSRNTPCVRPMDE